MHKIFSNTFDNVGRTEIGRQSEEDLGLRTLGTGVIQAILRESGKTPSLIHVLKKLASQLDTTVLAIFRNLDGVSWGGQLHLYFNCLII